MTALSFYYSLKPLIPRRLQIMIRRTIAMRKLRISTATWPIDQRAALAPAGWKGWPEQKKFALVLNHDVDTIKGHDQCGLLSDLEKRMGFRSSFYFVPEGYRVSPEQRRQLQEEGFEVGVHGLRHDGKMFASRKIFDERARRINSYLKEWGASGFSSPSMHRNLDWVGDLDIEYDISTFDTDPFEPQPEGICRIFPFWHKDSSCKHGFVEIPYTLPQDHNLYIILREKDIRIWVEKLDWIADKGGMALINTHPDYMRFDGTRCSFEEYPVDRYAAFLEHIKTKYANQYWHPLAKEMARFWKETMVHTATSR
jgi:peptidoglycan/xylan/chitin deacetylase (PgdA/CDA1 family)